MGRERREFKRESFVRDRQQLFVIASEGTETEPRYFEKFKSEEWYPNRTIYIEPLRRLDTNSSPGRVLKQLKDFKKEYNLKPGDELWMLIDRDKNSWTIREIDHVAQQCIQAKFSLALSNPSIEIWFLLHRTNLRDYNQQTLDELLENKKVGERSRCERELVRICGSYSKNNLNVDDFLPYVKHAIRNAEALVQNENERWPNGLGTHVYKLVKKLLPPEANY